MLISQLSLFTAGLVQRVHGTSQSSLANEQLGQTWRLQAQQRHSLLASFQVTGRFLLIRLPEVAWLRIAIHLDASSITERQRALLALTCTSKELRRRLLDMSVLWSMMHVRSSPKAALFLERCRPFSPYIKWYAEDAKHAVPVGAIIGNHLDTVKILDITVGNPILWQEACDALQRTAPALRWLALKHDAWNGSSVGPASIPEGLFANQAARLSMLTIRKARFQEGSNYLAFRGIVRLQYIGFGPVTPQHLQWLMTQFPQLQVLGIDNDACAAFNGSEVPPQPLEAPPSLGQVSICGVQGQLLGGLMEFLSQVPLLIVRPRYWSDNGLSFLFSHHRGRRLISMNCRWRRAVADFHSDLANHTSGQLLVYARRTQLISLLGMRPAADYLTRLSCDESSWAYFSQQIALDEVAAAKREKAAGEAKDKRAYQYTRKFPIVLPNLQILTISLASCVTERYNFGLKFGGWGGLWTHTDVLRSFKLPKLNELHLAHLSRWTCGRVVTSDQMRSKLSGPCRCYNRGLVSMSQVLDLLRQRRHDESEVKQRLPRLVLSGVTAILDDNPARTTEELKEQVEEVQVLTDVPREIQEEDEAVNDFHGMAVRSLRPSHTDMRYRVSDDD